MAADGDVKYKGFFANFKLVIADVNNNKLKDYDFQITGYTYENLQLIEDILQLREVKTDDELINNIYEYVKGMNCDKPLELFKKGNYYDWFMLSKFFDIFEGIMKT